MSADQADPDQVGTPPVDTGRQLPLDERFDEWAIRHSQMPALRRLLRLPIVFWRLGLGPLIGRFQVRHGHLVMLTVTGRSSGRPRHTPVTAHEVGDRTYLWCPYGGRAQWYRNVAVNPVVTVQSPRGTQVMRATGIEDVAEATGVVAELRRFDETFLRSYLAAEGIADTADDIAGNWQRLHLRRLEPTQAQGPAPLEADLAWLWLVPVGVPVVAFLAYRGVVARRSPPAAFDVRSSRTRRRRARPLSTRRHAGCGFASST